MVEKYDIEFVEADAPITDPVTKFGGQPVWLEEPRWPLSRKSGAPMTFICQIELFPELFGGEPGWLAYLFMTGDEGSIFAFTWEPDRGENALFVQPGGELPRVETIPEPEGPTLSGIDRAGPREYAAVLTPGEDQAPVSDAEKMDWDDEVHDSYHDALTGNKIGVRPCSSRTMRSPKADRGGSCCNST